MFLPVLSAVFCLYHLLPWIPTVFWCIIAKHCWIWISNFMSKILLNGSMVVNTSTAGENAAVDWWGRAHLPGLNLELCLAILFGLCVSGLSPVVRMEEVSLPHDPGSPHPRWHMVNQQNLQPLRGVLLNHRPATHTRFGLMNPRNMTFILGDFFFLTLMIGISLCNWDLAGC